MAKNSFVGGVIEKSILYNRAVLYFIFFLTLGYLFFLIIQTDYYTFVIFILIGFLTSFFSKNMTVILSLAMSVSFIFKYGTKIRPEGFQEGADTEKPPTISTESLIANELETMTPTKALEHAKQYMKMIDDDGKITLEFPIEKDMINNVKNDIIQKKLSTKNT